MPPPQKIFKFRALEMPFQPFPQDVFSKLMRRKMQKLVVYFYLSLVLFVKYSVRRAPDSVYGKN